MMRLALFLLPVHLFSLNFHDFDNYQHKYTKDEIEHKIETYLEKNSSIASFYQLTDEAFMIGHPEIDYTLHLSQESRVAPTKKAKSLEKAKIAIDPGHFGGPLAKVETNFISIPEDQIYFAEGDLAYLTALKLKELLEEKGAVVFITRPGLGQGAIEESFDEWLERHPDLTQNGASLTDIFRFYNQEDLIVRAKKINAFDPDITLVLHYNIGLTPFDNYSTVFIPGAFGSNELEKPEDRYEFLRLLVTDTIEESLYLSEKIMEQFSKHLGLAPISAHAKTTYRENYCLTIKPGIDCRNLALTRLVHSPLCYGEPLIQNNEEEIQRLATCDTSIAGYPCSTRLEQVAQAYFEGIKAYFERRLDEPHSY